MRDYVYKMLKKSLKNEALAEAVLRDFRALRILSNCADYDWMYECSKCNMVCEMVEARKQYNHRSILKAYKDQMKKTPYLWYDDFMVAAKNILKHYKE